MRLLVDSAAFVWLVSEPFKLSEVAHRLITDASNDLYLSAASVWEIAVKYQAGRLELSEDPAQLIPRAREAHGVLPLAFDEESALTLARLPTLHRDPFDRMLICQAVTNSMAIITPDEAIHRYPVRALW
ncbi:MAG: type II toxin-antitoxin system VapC family toxin [Chloroflexi bacterium]|nr:type II toxin-antitoxin system VapC family toxin [Chloroflexota bacterium]